MTLIPTLTIMLEDRHNLKAETSYYFFVIQELGFTFSQVVPYFFGESSQNFDEKKK